MLALNDGRETIEEVVDGVPVTRVGVGGARRLGADRAGARVATCGAPTQT